MQLPLAGPTECDSRSTRDFRRSVKRTIRALVLPADDAMCKAGSIFAAHQKVNVVCNVCHAQHSFARRSDPVLQAYPDVRFFGDTHSWRELCLGNLYIRIGTGRRDNCRSRDSADSRAATCSRGLRPLLYWYDLYDVPISILALSSIN